MVVTLIRAPTQGKKSKVKRQLNSLPKVKLDGELHEEPSAVTGRITNTGSSPALAIHLTLCDARTGGHILPVYYDNNYFSLLPGESHDFRIEFPKHDGKPQVDITGWNIEPGSLR